jgi:hypothetical protein
MKVIDKTPFQNKKGESGFLQRLRGALEYGMSWQAELDAQATVIAQMDRVLEKGYTLIRNLNLESSQIIEPLILVGPPGVYVIYVTPASGFFEAKGDEWNIINNDRRTPAPVNLLKRVARLARALQVYLNRQGVFLPSVVEPVLMASSPAVHIDSMRPIARVVMSDAVKQFAASLLQSRPILKSELIYDLVDHIVNPRSKAITGQTALGQPPTAQPAGAPGTVEGAAGEAQRPETLQPATPTREIFQAGGESKPFNPADLSFAFNEKGEAPIVAGPIETSASEPATPAARRRAFTAPQWASLALMLFVECAVAAGFVYLIVFRGR